MVMMDLEQMEDLSDHGNVAVVKDLYAAFLRADMPSILNLLAEDVDWYTVGWPDVPFAGQRFGHEQVKEFFKISAETVSSEDQHPQIEEIIADGTNL